MALCHLATASFVLLAGLTLLAPATRGEILELQSQTRTVGVQIDHRELHYESCSPPPLDPYCEPDFIDTTSYSDDAAAPDASPWVATANLAQFPNTYASQDSEIGGSSIRASGSHQAISYYTWPYPFPPPVIQIHEDHASDSSFSTTFVLTTAGFYQLTGSVSSTAGPFAESTAFIRLTGPGAEVVAEVQLTPDSLCSPAPDCMMLGPEPIAASGVLPPGTYTLEAGASGRAGGYREMNDIAYGDYDVELTLAGPVPALSASGLVLLALALGSLGAARIARQRG